ncbi:MAG: adenosylhomocysteinase [Thermoleophilaceae bacterium]
MLFAPASAALQRTAVDGRAPAVDVSSGSEIADGSLAAQGRERVEWADGQMPVLRRIRERMSRERPLDGLRVAACLHITSETANLVGTLLDGGAQVAICASNPLSTQDDTAAALVESGARVHAIRGEAIDTYYGHIEAVCETGPALTMDDGADLVSFLHGQRVDLARDMIGGTEQTTTGAIRVRALESERRLTFPVIAVNDSITGRLFDNRYGTGQSTLDGIVRATNMLLAGSRVVVIGYGWCGRGVALRARGAGANVVVCEVDPLRALEAALDGYSVMPILSAAGEGDLFITVTGGRDALTGAHFELMRDGATVCNAGHFDVEIDKGALERMTRSRRRVRPLVEEHLTQSGRRINLLAEGRVVNLAAAEGHPAAVMDVSFAAHALAIEHLARAGRSLEPRLYDVPRAIDDEISRLGLGSLGIEIDTLSDEQVAYLGAWQLGT